MPHPNTTDLPPAQRRQLGVVLVLGALVLLALAGLGMYVERQSRTPLVLVGQPAPAWTLPLAAGGTASLDEQRGKVVVLTFVPSMNCIPCRQQLGALQEALPDLEARGAAVFAISTDLSSVQRTFARQLGLSFGLLSEAPVAGFHLVASAYGVYHRADGSNGPVDTNAIIVIDGAGTVRAVAVQPSAPIAAEHIVALAGEAQP